MGEFSCLLAKSQLSHSCYTAHDSTNIQGAKLLSTLFFTQDQILSPTLHFSQMAGGVPGISFILRPTGVFELILRLMSNLLRRDDRHQKFQRRIIIIGNMF